MVLTHVGIPKDMGKTKSIFIHTTLHLAFEIDSPFVPALHTFQDSGSSTIGEPAKFEVV